MHASKNICRLLTDDAPQLEAWYLLPPPPSPESRYRYTCDMAPRRGQPGSGTGAAVPSPLLHGRKWRLHTSVQPKIHRDGRNASEEGPRSATQTAALPGLFAPFLGHWWECAGSNLPVETAKKC